MKRFLGILVVLALVFSLAAIGLPSPVQAQATFTVTNTNDSGLGSLRQAILDANATPVLDTIVFNIPDTGAHHTIQPVSALPTIIYPVIIDGYTQPGASPNTNGPGQEINAELMIELDGSMAGSSVDGLNITAGNSTVRGLVIHRFYDGIELNTGGGNVIEGNFIGTDVTGTIALANTAHGVRIAASPNNTIGGTMPESRNIISGNAIMGIDIWGDVPGNVVQGNLIGTDITGAVDLGNFSDGIFISGTYSNTIGGTTAGASNIISGNNHHGLRIILSTTNLVQGNFIGTDVTGVTALGNSLNGVYIADSANNTIGGTTIGAGNVISGNNEDGVHIEGTGATVNLVQGNFIGTDVTGTVDLGNSGDGVVIFDTSSNIIGGVTAGAGNVISGNNRGITITHSSATSNLVQGNFIGTDVSGTADLGNSGDGVHIWSASRNTIGGIAPEAGNVISGNGRDGITISHPDATSNLVQGNLIGTDITGTADLGNSINGVCIIDARNNTIGGMTAGAGNNIAFNAVDGVSVSSGTGNAILSNSIFSNGDLGIDLGGDGVTPNDPGDTDTGANNLQNFPVLTSATSGTTSIEGTFNSIPGTEFRLEFFSNSSCDPLGYGEGENFLGFTTVVTDSGGNASFTVALPDTVPAGQFITATATTDPNNNTSEFSQCMQVAVQATVDFDPDTLNLKSGGKVGTSEISIEAYIDGRSLLIITGNTVQWHHLNYAAPGRHEFVNLPTVINGMEWYPEWPDWPNEENRTECFSSVYEDLTPGLPESDMEVELEVTEARHSLSIVQHPSVDNDYALILDFDDNPPGGAAWYDCELIVTWQRGKAPVTVYIELPEGYDVEDIDVNTVELWHGEDSVSAEWGDVQGGTLMVKFNRSAVQGILTAGDEVEVTVSGELLDGMPFEGSDTIRVIN